MISYNSLKNAFTRASLGLLALYPAAASAAPGDSLTISGTGRASVVEPIGIQPVADLRFGRIIQPDTAGTLRIATNGAVTETGGVTGNAISTPQITNGRGPAAFAVFGDPNRWFVLFTPTQTTVSNGSATMLVNQFQANTFIFGLRRFDATGYADISVGARLNVNANQPVGTYSGTYNLTVLYL